MLDPLRRDYSAMTGMIFGNAPAFDTVMADIAELQARVNA